MPKNLPKSAKDIIWRMLTVDPKKRISIKEIKKHPFFLSFALSQTIQRIQSRFQTRRRDGHRYCQYFAHVLE